MKCICCGKSRLGYGFCLFGIEDFLCFGCCKFYADWFAAIIGIHKFIEYKYTIILRYE